MDSAQENIDSRAGRVVRSLAVFVLFVAWIPQLSAQEKARTPGSAVYDENAARISSASANPRPELQRRDSRYRLCVSDAVALTFPLTPEFDQTLDIQPDGFATLAGVGDVRLEGLTTQEVVRAVRNAYAKLLHDPIVIVELKNYNKPYFVVGGQVHQPGKYDLRGYTTATQAIAMAGGFNDSAKHSQVLLFRRVDNDWFEVKSLNLKRILQGHAAREDPELHPGDMLFVPTVSGLHERDPNAIPDLYDKSYRLIFFLAVPVFAFVVLASPVVSAIWLGRYDPLFVRFVTLLAAGWIVNVLCNPAYVVDLGTGALRWISIGCTVTAILNASLGVWFGMMFGGAAVVVSTVFSLMVGYVILLAAFHLENRIPFRRLLPLESAGILVASLLGALIVLPVFRFAQTAELLSLRTTLALAAFSLLIISAMWTHPMRKHLLKWMLARKSGRIQQHMRAAKEPAR